MKYLLAAAILMCSVGMVVLGQYPLLGISALGLAYLFSQH